MWGLGCVVEAMVDGWSLVRPPLNRLVGAGPVVDLVGGRVVSGDKVVVCLVWWAKISFGIIVIFGRGRPRW